MSKLRYENYEAINKANAHPSTLRASAVKSLESLKSSTYGRIEGDTFRKEIDGMFERVKGLERQFLSDWQDIEKTNIIIESYIKISDDYRALKARVEEGELKRQTPENRKAIEANERAIAQRQIERIEAETKPKLRSEDPPPRPAGMSDEEYYDSDAYYNWKHRDQ